MVRSCVIKNCKETDTTMLSHRFPKKEDMLNIWKNALNLQKHSSKDLLKKYVVCTKHFTAKNYRNEISNFLNTTAIPNLELNPNNPRSINKKDLEAPNTILSSQIDEPPKVIVLRPQIKRERSTQLLLNTVKKQTPENNDKDTKFELISVSGSKANPNEICIVEDVLVEEIIEQVVENSKSPNPDNSTQTDPIKEPAEMRRNTTSIDDEFLNTFYPELAPLSKKELIENLLEANRKMEVALAKLDRYEKVIKDLMLAKNKT